ncbi:MAG: tRNA uridine(34) 5-carboxymethylaminomethyl modification radical SAM/GNAT enzyme Elp3 [Anaerolineae bacterium]|nr:tRNA uridine(34) 5-carboxymethylaminomethyl modification radical SAM/GNAT enzyme Elp3 [Anaerolineae bacterium]
MLIHEPESTAWVNVRQEELLAFFDAVRAAGKLSATQLNALMVKHVHGADGNSAPQTLVVEAYKELTAQGVIPFERELFERLRQKPTRTISGVAPVAVLTGPYPCPADCIFCPDAKGVPRSYLPDEPAVQRAMRERFDPFKSVKVRMDTLASMGHPTDKIELLIIGATWSAYPKKYQEWYVRRCLDAMNGGDPAKTLEEAQVRNETAAHRNVGLVIETRPDYVDMAEVRRLRWLGMTKIQLGAQSTNNEILKLNRRDHTIEDTRRAVRLLRLAGFKLHLHWMPNLYGATPEGDVRDYENLWTDTALRPDELKIYPCMLIEDTELYRLWQAGKYRPYTDEELIETLAQAKRFTPPYCRINRVIRDIPAQYIAAGSTQSNLRVVVQSEMKRRGWQCQCIRCREVRNERVDRATLEMQDYRYETDATTEHFLQYLTPTGKLAGFLRLSLPHADVPSDEILPELRGNAMVRELHIFGPAIELGTNDAGKVQHSGLGRRLAERAIEIAREAGFKRLAVISALGTREYYRKLGFELEDLYMLKSI